VQRSVIFLKNKFNRRNLCHYKFRWDDQGRGGTNSFRRILEAERTSWPSLEVIDDENDEIHGRGMKRKATYFCIAVFYSNRRTQNENI
jgi:hypothetical protein